MNAKNELQAILNNGMDYEDIIKLLADMKAEEMKREQELRKQQNEAKVDEARIKVIEAVLNYAVTAGILEKEDIEDIDMNHLVDEVKGLEKEIKRMKKMLEMKQNLPFFLGERPIIPKEERPAVIKATGSIDEDTLRKFIEREM